MKVIKKVEVEGKVKEIHFNLVSSDLVDANESKNNNSEDTINKLHKHLKQGAKIVLVADKQYKQHF